MHLVSPFPFSLLGPCFLIWAYHIYIYFFSTLYRTSFSSVEYLKKCFLFKEDFSVFIVIWISSFIHAFIILLYFIQVSFFSFFFCKGSICVYLCPTASCIHSKYLILFCFICKKQFVQVLQIIWTFVVQKTIIVCSATLKWSLARVCWQCIGEFGHKEVSAPNISF